MSGWIVVPLTIAFIVLFIYAVTASESMLTAMLDYYHAQKPKAQILLLLPLAIVAIWHVLACLIATILGLFAGYSLLKYVTHHHED